MSWLLAFAAGVLILPLAHALNVCAGVWVRRGLRDELRRRSRGALVLTYDDGVSERFEPRLLALLREHGAHATFFLLGARSEGRQHRVRDLEEAGQEVGNHSFAHLDAFRTDPLSVARDLRSAHQVFHNLGARPGIFRPPHGRMTLSGWLQIRKLGYRVAMWTQDGGDTAPTLPRAEEVADAIRRDGGGVVLLHSHDRSEVHTDREEYVLELTRQLLELARKEGLVVKPCSAVLAPEEDR